MFSWFHIYLSVKVCDPQSLVEQNWPDFALMTSITVRVSLDHFSSVLEESEGSDWVLDEESVRGRKRVASGKKRGTRKTSSPSRGRGRTAGKTRRRTMDIPQAMGAVSGGESRVDVSEASSIGVCGAGVLAGSETEGESAPIQFLAAFVYLWYSLSRVDF